MDGRMDGFEVGQLWEERQQDSWVVLSGLTLDKVPASSAPRNKRKLSRLPCSVSSSMARRLP